MIHHNDSAVKVQQGSRSLQYSVRGGTIEKVSNPYLILQQYRLVEHVWPTNGAIVVNWQVSDQNSEISLFASLDQQMETCLLRKTVRFLYLSLPWLPSSVSSRVAPSGWHQ